MAWRTSILLPLALPLTLLSVACGDDESVSTGLSGGSASASSTGGESSSSSDSGSGVTNETTAGSSSSSSSSSSSTTDQTTDPTTSTTDPTTSTTDPTTDPTTSTSTTTTSTTGGGGCGNGALDPGEQCDGANLGGFTCEALGYGGGSLSCDPVMCILDTSLCEMGGSTGGTSG